MANKKISDLNPAAPLQDGDLLAVVQDTGSKNETRKTTVGALRSGMGGGGQMVITSGNGSITVQQQGNTVDLRSAQVITSVDGSITVSKQGNTVDLSREFYVKKSIFSFSTISSYYALKLIEITTHSNTKGAFTFDVSSWGMPHLYPYYGEFLVDLFLAADTPGPTGTIHSKFKFKYFGGEFGASGLATGQILPVHFVLIRKDSTTAELWKIKSFTEEEVSLLGIKLCNAQLNVIDKPETKDDARFSTQQGFDNYAANYIKITPTKFANIS